jgi:hypothetical protein
MVRDFQIGTILSITHEALMSPISDIYEILNYMTGNNLYTHQLPRVARECKPFLLKQHPQLAQWVDDVTPENVRARLADAVAQFGEMLSVEPLAKDEHEFIDPMSELTEKVHPGRIIPITI